MSSGGLFAWPAAWPLLLLVPPCWLVLRALDRSRARRLARAVGPRAPALAAELGPRRRRLRRVLTTAGLALALCAVLQPLWGTDVRRIEQRGVDLLVCLDVSRSMLARDVEPSRLERAKREIGMLAGRAQGDRLGLVAFAGDARLLVPLTRDLESFADLVDLCDPLSVGRGGTDLGAALEAALDGLAGRTGEHEAVLLITDGEDLEQRGLRVAETCRERNIAVHCAGIGSALGSKITVERDGGEVFLRDRGGDEVVSVMDARGLGEIAERTGGAFVDAGARPRSLVELYESRIRPMARKSFDADLRRGRKNRFQWPLLAALLLWVLELSLSDRRRR